MLRHSLELTRPIAVLDLETTGLDPDKDRIIQIAVTMHYVDKDPIAWASLINPGIPIPPTVHGITDEMVADAPPFSEYAAALAPRLLAVDIAGYNVTFDIGFLRAEMKRARVDFPWNNHIVDAYQIYRRMYPHSLLNAWREYGDGGRPMPPGAKYEAHDAGADVAATERTLRGQLERHAELPRTVPELAAWCFPQAKNAIDSKGKIIWHNDVVCITFGKHARNGPKPIKDLERSYLEWCIGAEFIDQEVKDIFRRWLAGDYPIRP